MEKQNPIYRFFQHIANVWIYGRIWIALCVFSYVQSSFILFHGEYSVQPFAVILALGSYLLYIVPFLYFGLIKKTKRSYNPRQVWIEERITRLYATGGAALLGLLVAVFLHPSIVWLLVQKGVVIAIISVLYMLPVIPWKGKRYALREIGGLKPIILTLVWWYMGAYIVAKDSPHEMSCFKNHLSLTGDFLLALQFVFMLVLCVMFDIRDYDSDKQNGIRTWPVMLGIGHTQMLMLAVCIVAIIPVWFMPVPSSVKYAYTVTFGVLAFFNTQKLTAYPWWFYDVAVDGMMILQWVLLVALSLQF
ncbi:MAG TPA: hypothetical protein VEC12_06295 [Bacteroidia bacterium]|nr:hypothetical protein [Bacteroidia bacterium]